MTPNPTPPSQPNKRNSRPYDGRVLHQRHQLPILNPAEFVISGYASVTEVLIPDFDLVIARGAFASVLERTPSVPIYANHDFVDTWGGTFKLQIGETTVLLEDDFGLFFEGRLFSTSVARDALGVMQGRGRMPASFSFDFGEVVTDEETGVGRILSFSRLWELGPATWGANPAAFVEIGASDQEPETQSISRPDAAPYAASLAAAVSQIRRLTA